MEWIAGSDARCYARTESALPKQLPWYGNVWDVFGVSENQDELPTGASGNSEPGTASQPAETADVAETASNVDQEVEAIPIGVPTSRETWRELKRQADEPD